MDRAEPRMETVGAALRALVCHPGDRLLRRWNWKSALVSSVCRALIFLAANLPAGRHAALRAMLTEFLFRAVAAGSVAFSVVTTLFNLFAMRRGALIVGEGRATLADDLRRMPQLIVAFCRAGARAIIGCQSNLFT